MALRPKGIAQDGFIRPIIIDMCEESRSKQDATHMGKRIGLTGETLMSSRQKPSRVTVTRDEHLQMQMNRRRNHASVSSGDLEEPTGGEALKKKVNREAVGNGKPRQDKTPSEPVPTLKCETCKKTFMTKSGFVRHGFIHADLRQFICEFCGKGFNSASTLIGHRRRHIGDKRYKCRYCEQKFVETSNRKNHERRHTGEKPYTCDICFRSFAVSCTLVKHRRIHTNETPYICHLCCTSYRQYYGLKRHMEKIHLMFNVVLKQQISKSVDTPTIPPGHLEPRPMRKALQDHHRIWKPVFLPSGTKLAESSHGPPSTNNHRGDEDA